MATSIQYLVIQQLRGTAAERREAKSERRELMEQHLGMLEKKARIEGRAQNQEIDLDVDKSITSAATSPFGAIGSIAGGITNICLDETKGRDIADLERRAGLVEASATSIKHDLDETRSVERARSEEARQIYDAAAEVIQKKSELSRLS